MKLVYLAKPTYGGWVTMTAHLALKYRCPVMKVGKRTETCGRDFGYGVFYQNTKIEEIVKKDNLLITAIDKSYYGYLNQFPDKTPLVIHDPTELTAFVVQSIKNKQLKVITIREKVQQHLKEKHNIDSMFLYHPFHLYNYKLGNKENAVSISRVDYDKKIEMIVEANKHLIENYAMEPIDIYGKQNERYIFHKLKDTGYSKFYKGRFGKDFAHLTEILKDARFVVDMSVIKNDGGGSQYTFLEAIYENCCLVLNKRWLTSDCEFVPGQNCLAVEDGEELADLLYNVDKEHVAQMAENARPLLKKHIREDWMKVFQ
jgi:hypothetical protein